MKRLGLYLVLGCVLLAPAARAQDAKLADSQDFAFSSKLTKDGLQGAAMMGAFFDPLRRASSYRGHFTETTIYFKAGKEIHRISSDVRLAWLRNGIEPGKSELTANVSNIGRGKTQTLSYCQYNNGEQILSFVPDKTVWCGQPQKVENDDSAILTHYALGFWKTTLIALNKGDKASLFTRVESANSETVFAIGTAYEAVFDSNTGQLKSFKTAQTKEGTRKEFHLIELELNAPLPNSTGQWTPPDDARKVPNVVPYMNSIFF